MPEPPLPFMMSMYVSLGLYQKTPTVWDFEWPIINGMAPATRYNQRIPIEQTQCARLTVECHGYMEVVLEHVQVVQTVRLLMVCVFTTGGAKRTEDVTDRKVVSTRV